MSLERFDVAVVGGGPAGCATALTLAKRGCSTILFEGSRYENQRIGETLPPETRKLLLSLGVWERFLADRPLQSPGKLSAWGTDQVQESNFIRNPYGFGWHIDRSKFDRIFFDAAKEAGTQTYLGTSPILGSQNNFGNWDIEFKYRQQQRHVQASFLVDATGRQASLARKCGAKRTAIDRLIGVVGFLLPSSSVSQQTVSTLVEAVEDGWWYSAILPDNRLVVALMTDSDLVRANSATMANNWLHAMNRATNTRNRAKGFSLEAAPGIHVANTSRLKLSIGARWLAVGDAAMSFDPLSSQGVYRALEYGLMAASSICDYQIGNRSSIEKYAFEVEKCFASYLAKRQAFYMLESRWRNATFWKRRRSIPSGRMNLHS